MIIASMNSRQWQISDHQQGVAPAPSRGFPRTQKVDVKNKQMSWSDMACAG